MTETTLDPESMAARLEGAAAQLAQVMEREVELLRGLRGAEIEALLAEKKAAAGAYRELIGRLSGQPALLRGLDPERRAALEAAGRRLAAAMAANAKALKAGIDANGSLVRAIAQAVRAEDQAADPYAADGRRRVARADAATPAVSVNQVL